jgi:hypothetical protein
MIAERLLGKSKAELDETDFRIPSSADECSAFPTPRQNVRFRVGLFYGRDELERRKKSLLRSSYSFRLKHTFRRLWERFLH